MDGVWLDGRTVAHQSIQNVNGLPDAARDEMAEQQDVEVTHVMVGNPSVPAIANVLLRQQVLLGQFILCAIGSGALFIAPIARQRIAIEAINYVAQCRVQLVRRDVAAIDVGQLLSGKLASEMASHLVWAEIRSIRENGEQLPLKRIGDFRLI